MYICVYILVLAHKTQCSEEVYVCGFWCYIVYVYVNTYCMCICVCVGMHRSDVCVSSCQIAAKIQPTGQKRPLEETESGMDRVPGRWWSQQRHHQICLCVVLW